MKKNLLAFLSLLVLASMMIAACATESDQGEPKSFVVQGATPEPGLRPMKDYDAVLHLKTVYSEGPSGTKSHGAQSWLDSYWFVTEAAGDTPAVAPSVFEVSLKKGNFEQNIEIAPGGNSSVYNGRPEEFEILNVSATGWTCDRRPDSDIWDCKFNK
jgi:hypothetical protein